MIDEKYEEITQHLIKFKTNESDNRTITLRRCDDNETLSLTLSVFPAGEFDQLIEIVDKFIQDKIIDCTNGEM